MSDTRDLGDGEVAHVQGSAAKPYEIKNTGGVYSCSCPAWRNQSVAIDLRTCKHIKRLRGEAAELERVGTPTSVSRPAQTRSSRSRSAPKSTAPPVLLAQSWDSSTDLTGWWMSEKLDGVRAYWNGGEFVSRLGNVYRAPKWFVDGLPDRPLDGELWCGRRLFQKTVSIVRRHDAGEHWREVRFVVFDMPELDEPFETRISTIEEHFAGGDHPYAQALDHERCRGIDHVNEALARVEALGGEGLMVRQPGSRYVAGRSSTLLKIKNFFDAEARVIGHVAGAGRHRGRTGALEVELPDGTRFAVGTGLSDAAREQPPEPGSIITFRYQELSKDGVPRFPTYVGVRHDFHWPETAPTSRAKSRPATSKPAIVSQPQRATTPKQSAPGTSGAGKRRFELDDGASSKFWEIEVSGDRHTVTWGRLGTGGQTKTKIFADAAKALADAEKRIAEKTKKGYRETSACPA
jgi:DNA ligase 1